MRSEICQHGYDITNKRTPNGTSACPEGCLSNDQRADENKQLCNLLAEAQLQCAQLKASTVTPQAAVEFLNQLNRLDPRTMYQLCAGTLRAHCNEAMANHPTVQCLDLQACVMPSGYPRSGHRYEVGLVGILNGLFGVDQFKYGPIVMVFDSEIQNIPRFETRENWVRVMNYKGIKPEPVEPEVQTLRKQVTELEAWKESAMARFREVDFQGVQRELGLPLGVSVPQSILPGIRALKAKIAELLELSPGSIPESPDFGCHTAPAQHVDITFKIRAKPKGNTDSSEE